MSSRKNVYSMFACAALALLTLCFFNDVIFGGRTLKGSITMAQALDTGPYGQENNLLPYIPYIANDAAVLDEPYLEFKKNTFLQGIFPLWNPRQACGTPFFATGQAAVLFPLSIFLYFIPEKYSWDFYIILQIFLAGLFTFYFMRILKYPHMPSVIAAIAYMFSGPIITWMINVTTGTSVMLPLLFICVEKIIRERNRKWLVISSFIVGATIMSGHPEHIFFAFLTASLYFLLRIILIKKQDNIDRIRVFKSAFIALFLGLLLASIYILPFMECITHSWTSHDSDIGATSEEKPSGAITILMPYFFQKELLTIRYKREGWNGGYLGIIAVLLGLIGAVKKDKDRNNIIFAAIGFFIISKCYGVWPVNLIGYLPVFNKLRYSLHYTQDFAFAMAVLSGIGLNRLMESKSRRREMLFAALLAASVIFGYMAHYRNMPHPARTTMYAFILLILFVSTGHFRSKKVLSVLMGLLLAAELFYLMPSARAKKYDSFPKVPYIEFLKEQKPRMRSFGMLWALFPDTATGYGIDDLGVYEGLIVKRFVEYVKTCLCPEKFEKGSFVPALRSWLPDLKSRFLDLLNVGYIITPVNPMAKQWIGPDAGELVYSNEVNIYKRSTAFPRAFIARGVLFAKDEKEAAELMNKNYARLRNTVVIEGENNPEIKDILRRMPLYGASEVEIKKYTPDRVYIEASLDYPGMLILSDTYYPGWKAYVDGKETRLFCADLFLRAVFLTQGRHTVKFYFRPVSFMIGMWLTIAAAALLILILIRFAAKPLSNFLD